MEDCIFCKIINKKIHASIIYEDEKIIAFDDIKPQAPVHVLLIPKEHYASLNDVPDGDESILAHLLLKARQIAYDKGIGEDGYRLVLNTGGNSGQEIFHIHLHLLGGRRMTWPPG